MKPQIKKVVLGIILLLFALPKLVSSQATMSCPFYIQNHRNCDITVHYESSDCNSNACLGSGVGVVDYNAGLVIHSGGTFLITTCYSYPYSGFPTAPGCGAGGDIFVWLKEIDYVDVTYSSNAYSVSGGNCLGAGSVGSGATGTAPVPSTVSPPCNSPSTYQVIWSANGVDIW